MSPLDALCCSDSQFNLSETCKTYYDLYICIHSILSNVTINLFSWFHPFCLPILSSFLLGPTLIRLNLKELSSSLITILKQYCFDVMSSSKISQNDIILICINQNNIVLIVSNQTLSSSNSWKSCLFQAGIVMELSCSPIYVCFHFTFGLKHQIQCMCVFE